MKNTAFLFTLLAWLWYPGFCLAAEPPAAPETPEQGLALPGPLTLQQCLTVALERNPDLEASRLDSVIAVRLAQISAEIDYLKSLASFAGARGVYLEEREIVIKGVVGQQKE